MALQERKLINYRSPYTRAFFLVVILFKKSFIHLSNEYFLSIRYGPGMEPGSEKTVVNRASLSPHAGVYS